MTDGVAPDPVCADSEHPLAIAFVIRLVAELAIALATIHKSSSQAGRRTG